MNWILSYLVILCLIPFHCIHFYSLCYISTIVFSIQFYSIMFCSFLFCSFLFCSILLYSILLYSTQLFCTLLYPILFYSTLFQGQLGQLYSIFFLPCERFKMYHIQFCNFASYQGAYENENEFRGEEMNSVGNIWMSDYGIKTTIVYRSFYLTLNSWWDSFPFFIFSSIHF